MHQGLAKNPANRYASAAEMREDLERFLSGRPVLATPVLVADAATTVFADDPDGTALMTTPLEEEEEPRRRVWLWILIGLLIAGAVAFLLYLLANSLIGPNKTKPVPDVVGLPLPAAQIKLEDAGFKLADPKFVASGKPKNQVLKQDPEAEAEAEEGSEVLLTVSGGKQQIAVPDISGLTLAKATDLLTQNQLTLGQQIAAVSDPEVPAKRIISQQPNPGEKVAVGSAVNYIISTGPEAVAIPDERCQKFVDAFNDLRDKGLQPIDGGEDPNGPNLNCPDTNSVSRTDPPAGSQVDPDSTVTIYRSFQEATTPPTTPATTAPTTPPTTPPTTAPTTGPTTTGP